MGKKGQRKHRKGPSVSQTKIQDNYAKLIKMPELQGEQPLRFITYNCKYVHCKRETIVEVLNKGLFEEEIKCPVCNNKAKKTKQESTFKRVPSLELYRPSLNELLKHKNNPEVISYVFKGYLFLRHKSFSTISTILVSRKEDDLKVSYYQLLNSDLHVVYEDGTKDIITTDADKDLNELFNLDIKIK